MSLKKLVVSICDYSGDWSRPYLSKGYDVVRIDPKHSSLRYGGRGLTSEEEGSPEPFQMPDGGFAVGATAGSVLKALREGKWMSGRVVSGVLLAVPCTDFAVSGARHWASKDADGRTQTSVELVNQCLDLKDALRPEWWVLENPAGRIRRLVPRVGKLVRTFHPWMFAGWADDPQSEAYTKLTCLFGDFNPDLEARPVEPVMFTTADGKRGSWMWAHLGGSSERTKELRSKTPEGFSRAFAEAQCH